MGGEDGHVMAPELPDAPREGTRARIERAALDLFTRRGFEGVTIDEVSDAAGISRRTYFRYFATKADAVWGDFSEHVARLAALLTDSGGQQPVLASICDAYVEVNDYSSADLPLLRQRMQLILTEPALLAHSQLRYADIDRVVAEYVAARTGAEPGGAAPAPRGRELASRRYGGLRGLAHLSRPVPRQGAADVLRRARERLRLARRPAVRAGLT
jgi:mycofactocin system transcriptional regulator